VRSRHLNLVKWGKFTQPGHPFFCSLSAIQILFCITMQENNLQFRGDHIFQTEALMVVGISPSNCIL
jgi:hypothetical protein